MKKESKYFNALNLILKANYKTISKLKLEFTSYEKAFNSFEGKIGKIDIDNEWQKLIRQNIRLILTDDQEYPALLKEIPFPPLGIYVKGELPENNETRIAIVGTRKATTVGRDIAECFAKELGENGLTIVSGLALGIDSASHLGALKAKAKTIAVLGNEIGSFYPRQNHRLAKQILETGGCIISEYPLGSPTYRDNFLARNRIISGLSTAIIIIEAPFESGSLNTARYAIEQNREIFVVPGPLNNKNYDGSLKLLREGARLITSAKDVLEDLGIETKTLPTSRQAKKEKQKSIIDGISDKNQITILKALEESGTPLTIDKISFLAKLEPQAANQAISFLIIEGIVKETEKGFII
ncbi:MAG: DNA-processing protein DprA [Candidatus Paceibacterota bacterium]|jgi:DNA processing protein